MNPTTLAVELFRIAVPLLAGLLAAALLDRAAHPRVRSEASPWSPLVGAGLWLAAFAAATWATGRPIAAACAVLAAHGALVALGNAKYHACGEPLVYADLSMCVEALRDSRHGPAYLDARAMMAWSALALFAVLGVAAAEAPLSDASIVPLAVLLAAAIAIVRGATPFARRALTADAVQDLARFGFAAGLWVQAMAERHSAPARRRTAFPALPKGNPDAARLPHVVCIQGEAFFDARRLHASVRRDVLARFDTACETALHRGRLEVPAFAGHPLRAEHAFLTGVAPAALGIDAHNPYRRLDAPSTPSFVRELRARGYRTVCLLPHPPGLLGRGRALEGLGFDHVVDLSALAVDGTVSDHDLAEAVLRLVEAPTDAPLLVVAHAMAGASRPRAGALRPEDVAGLHAALPPAGGEALTAFLRRLRDADAMVGRLAQGLRWLERDAIVCIHGMHAPGLPGFPLPFGAAEARTDYAIWRAHREATPRREDRRLESLGALVLAEALHVRVPESHAPARKAEPSRPRAAIIRSSVGA